MQDRIKAEVPNRGVTAVASGDFDAKRDFGRPLLHRLQRARSGLHLSRKLRLPKRQRLADSLWRGFLDSANASFLAEAPSAITGKGHQGCANWRDLKYWTFIASCFEQHRSYEKLLSSYDESLPEATLGIGHNAWFFGSGHGRSTLNSYRVFRPSSASVTNEQRFEKVYSNAYDDFTRVALLEANAGPHLRARGILLPTLLEAFRGEQITIVHSAYVHGKPLDPRKSLARGADVVETLMSVPVVDSDLDPVLSRYHATFNEALANARSWLARRKPEQCAALDTIATMIEARYPRFFAHGDLHRKNMFDQGAVLDWDSWGLYPIGFDPGLMLSKTVRGGTLEDLEVVLREYYLRGVARDYEPYLMQGALFFAFVFGSGKKSVMAAPLLMDILDRALALTPGEVA